MVKQERAARTHQALVRAAAIAFDSAGYDATSLVAVARTAGLSLGALTFHFRAKEDLADAVQREGHALTSAAVDRRLAGRKATLTAVAAVTIELAWQLETNVTVRAAARLSRERTRGADCWPTAWRPHLERLLGAVADTGGRRGADTPALLALAECLVAGAELRTRSRNGPAAERGHGSAAWLAGVWELILPAFGP